MGRPARSGCATPVWHSCPGGLAPERLCVPQGATAMQSGRNFSPLLSLLETNCEYNGKFHAVQKTPSHKANIYRWKVFILSNARAGKVGLHSHTRKENPADYWAQDASERRQGGRCGGQMWKFHLHLSPSTPQRAVQSAGLGPCHLHGLITWCLHLKGFSLFNFIDFVYLMASKSLVLMG